MGSAGLKTRFEPDGANLTGVTVGGDPVDFYLVVEQPAQWRARNRMDFEVQVGEGRKLYTMYVSVSIMFGN